MDNLLLSAASRKLLDAYIKCPSHALILKGLDGVGLRTVARTVAGSIAPNQNRVMIIEPEKGLISIERVRQLYQQTRTIHREPLVIVVDDADTLSVDAQNALLKLFEEPVENVHFILTTHRPEALLATIVSRAQTVEVQPLDAAASMQLLQSLDVPESKVRQMLFLAHGLPAELHRLAAQEEHFTTQADLVKDARQVIESPLYERLKLVKKYSGRDEALQLVAMCGRLLGLNLVKQKNYRVSAMIESVLEAGEALRANGHVKTQLMRLMTKLG